MPKTDPLIKIKSLAELMPAPYYPQSTLLRGEQDALQGTQSARGETCRSAEPASPVGGARRGGWQRNSVREPSILIRGLRSS